MNYSKIKKLLVLIGLLAQGGLVLADSKDQAGKEQETNISQVVEIVDFDSERDLDDLLKICHEDQDLLFLDCSPEWYFAHMAHLHQIKVLKENGKTAGFVGYCEKPHPWYAKRTGGTVDIIAVSKDFRRKGYGRKLLEYVVKELFKMGNNVVALAVVTHNKPARALYERVGFKIANTIRWHNCFVYALTQEDFTPSVAQSNVASNQEEKPSHDMVGGVGLSYRAIKGF